MIRAVIDTNVLASGFIEFAVSTGTPSRLLRLWRDQRFELVTSDEIMSELLKTLRKPYFRRQITGDQIQEVEQLLLTEATAIRNEVAMSGVAPHPEDDLVLATAVSANADYLVTGDKRFLAVGSHAGVNIVSPRAFLDVLEGENV